MAQHFLFGCPIIKEKGEISSIMEKRKILIIDDEIGMLEVCFDTLSKLPAVFVVTESDSEKGSHLLKTNSYDLLITDLRMPKTSGMDILKIAKETNPNCNVLIMTAFPTIESAVKSMKLGAYDYLTKPLEPSILLSTVQRILEQKHLIEENRLLSRYVEKSFLFDDMIGQAKEMKKIFNIIKQVADTNTDVLILGKSGTGKELVARNIYKHSKRKVERFVPVDCGAIPENLLENEFFGHEKGAFTGAQTKSYGLLEFANKGILFLDEICELPLALQAKILRVLQERTFRRIGGKDEITIDIQIIASTNRDIVQEVENKRFREDLFYRLNVIQINLPSLRQRKEDIPYLVKYFLRRFSKELGKEIKDIDSETLEVLASYSWPGNIRQLQNILKRAIVLTKNVRITLDDIPDDIIISADEKKGKTKGFFGLRSQKIEKFEEEYLNALLHKCHGNVQKAAQEALVPRGTYYRLMKKYGLDVSSFK